MIDPITGPPADDAEWLQADGLGGFASGTAGLVRTRRYHALLLTDTAPGQRWLLVNGMQAWVQLGETVCAIGNQRYAPGVIDPADAAPIVAFDIDPWPRWVFALPGGGRLVHELFVAPGIGQTCLRWRFEGQGAATLSVRLLLSGRDYHATHHENAGFGFEPAEQADERVVWAPYPGVPCIAAHGGRYRHEPVWYRNFFYTEEAARGLDCTEDLASPGVLTWDLAHGEATLALRADRQTPLAVAPLALQEAARRGALPAPYRLAEPFVATRGGRATVIAGYPWFTDWGRDTFIAMRGLLIATGALEQARAVLLAWAPLVDQGMLPNRFPDGGGPPAYNSVDASLWFIVAVHDLLATGAVPVVEADALRAACDAILAGYSAGTRFGIGLRADGLIAAGQTGTQLTWMDAKVGDWVVTPRIGKPVEIQALWINALAIAGAWTPGWRPAEARARAAFLARFTLGAAGGLADVVDCDGVSGVTDPACRPNQVFAAGGLPFTCVPDGDAAAILNLVEDRLLTPLGLRTLDPADAGYQGRYEGDALARDGAYHQGTVWPWLMGPFVQAWLRLRRNTPEARAEARVRFLAPLRAHLGVAGLGSVSEIADGDAPHTPRGCPFQAWSMGELIRIDAMTGPRA